MIYSILDIHSVTWYAYIIETTTCCMLQYRIRNRPILGIIFPCITSTYKDNRCISSIVYGQENYVKKKKKTSINK